MDDVREQGVGRWTAIALVGLLTVLAGLAVNWPRPPSFTATLAKVLPPTGPAVQVWLSTADRKLRLARQADVVADGRAANDAIHIGSADGHDRSRVPPRRRSASGDVQITRHAPHR